MSMLSKCPCQGLVIAGMCPLHQSAPNLLNACVEANRILLQQHNPSWEDEKVMEMLQGAIARAGLK